MRDLVSEYKKERNRDRHLRSTSGLHVDMYRKVHPYTHAYMNTQHTHTTHTHEMKGRKKKK